MTNLGGWSPQNSSMITHRNLGMLPMSVHFVLTLMGCTQSLGQTRCAIAFFLPIADASATNRGSRIERLVIELLKCQFCPPLAFFLFRI
jgi:hypothetical protein